MTGAQAGKNAFENNELLILPALIPVPGLPLSSGDKVAQDANKNIVSYLDKAFKGYATEEGTPAMTDGPSVVEARDEAAKSRDSNVAKHLTDEQKKELSGPGSGTGTLPPPENDTKNRKRKKSIN